MNDKVTYWIEMSDYDFDTAKAMLETKRLKPSVTFMWLSCVTKP